VTAQQSNPGTVLSPGYYLLELCFTRPVSDDTLYKALGQIGFGVVSFDASLPPSNVDVIGASPLTKKPTSSMAAAAVTKVTSPAVRAVTVTPPKVTQPAAPPPPPKPPGPVDPGQSAPVTQAAFVNTQRGRIQTQDPLLAKKLEAEKRGTLGKQKEGPKWTPGGPTAPGDQTQAPANAPPPAPGEQAGPLPSAPVPETSSEALPPIPTLGDLGGGPAALVPGGGGGGGGGDAPSPFFADVPMASSAPAAATGDPVVAAVKERWQRWAEWGDPMSTAPVSRVSGEESGTCFRVLVRLDRPIIARDTEWMRWVYVRKLSFDPFAGMSANVFLPGNFRPFPLIPGKVHELRFLTRDKSQPTRDDVRRALSDLGFGDVKLHAVRRNVRLPGKPSTSLSLWWALGRWDGPSSFVTPEDPLYFDHVT
jgi:hypothetical protein